MPLSETKNRDGFCVDGNAGEKACIAFGSGVISRPIAGASQGFAISAGKNQFAYQGSIGGKENVIARSHY
jgi:hypothetical protein